MNVRFAAMGLIGIWGLINAGLVVADESKPARPNIVLIVADDLGYGELGCQGQTRDIPTPRIDSIAKNGVRFTNGYVSCPVCSPTRAGLMTGRYQQRFGHEFNPGNEQAAGSNFGLVRSETTLAERLKELGYATGMVGKWHLGFREGFRPTERGFDSFYGFLGGAHPYLPMARKNPTNSGIFRGTKPVAAPEYLTDAFAQEAVSFINDHKDGPFFLYLPFNAVHAPLQATGTYRKRFDSIPDEKRGTFAAMLTVMDDAVGQVLDTIHDAKLDENTLVIFLSDNGGPTAQTSSRNDPLRGHKAQVFEGGIRIPFLMQWTGRLPAGKVDDRPVISLDIHPTAVAAAGGSIPLEAHLDGVDLVPYLTDKATGTPHDQLTWRFGKQAALREGPWKLVLINKQLPALYNLSDDIGESHDLAAQEPERLKAMQTAYQAWNAQLAEPRWPQNAQAKKNAPAREPTKAQTRKANRKARTTG